MSSCAAESEVDITGVVAAEEEDDEIDAKTTDGWHIFGRECPKEEIVFLCQVIILYTVIVVSIYNLTVAHDDTSPTYRVGYVCLASGNAASPRYTIRTTGTMFETPD